MTDRPGLAPLIPYTGLLAGRYLYRDAQGGDPQLVRIDIIEGDFWATFLDAEPEDEDVRVLARDMAGEFERV